MVHNKTKPPHPSVSVLQNMEMIRPEFDCTKVNKHKTFVTRNKGITGRNQNVIQNCQYPLLSAPRLIAVEKQKNNSTCCDSNPYSLIIQLAVYSLYCLTDQDLILMGSQSIVTQSLEQCFILKTFL
jgi:hypothetical protein